MKQLSSRDFGKQSEKEARKFLKKHGYKILDKNWKCKIGEIDIIAKKDGVICFVEVKARRTDSFGPAQYAVTQNKQRKLVKLALSYLNLKKLDNDLRFDVLTKQEEKWELIENAF